MWQAYGEMQCAGFSDSDGGERAGRPASEASEQETVFNASGAGCVCSIQAAEGGGEG